MIVSTSILGTFVILTLSTVVPGIKISNRAESALAAQKEVVLAFDRLIAEMGLMDRASFSFDNGALSFLSHKPYGGSNTEVPDSFLQLSSASSLNTTWEKHVVLRHRETSLFRQEYPYNKGGELSRIAPDQLLSFADTPDTQRKIFAHNIEHFETLTVGHSRIAIMLRSVDRSNARPEACQISYQLSMRGGL